MFALFTLKFSLCCTLKFLENFTLFTFMFSFCFTLKFLESFPLFTLKFSLCFTLKFLKRFALFTLKFSPFFFLTLKFLENFALFTLKFSLLFFYLEVSWKFRFVYLEVFTLFPLKFSLFFVYSSFYNVDEHSVGRQMPICDCLFPHQVVFVSSFIVFPYRSWVPLVCFTSSVVLKAVANKLNMCCL